MLAHAPEGGVLVTLQVHLNVIAVASHAELAAVIFAGDRTPDDEVLAKAAAEGLALYVVRRPTRSTSSAACTPWACKGSRCVNVCLAQTCTCTRRCRPARRRDDAAGDRRAGAR